jgi:hypothetical protein
MAEIRIVRVHACHEGQAIGVLEIPSSSSPNMLYLPDVVQDQYGTTWLKLGAFHYKKVAVAECQFQPNPTTTNRGGKP